jgi:hypothetical protein
LAKKPVDLYIHKITYLVFLVILVILVYKFNCSLTARVNRPRDMQDYQNQPVAFEIRLCRLPNNIATKLRLNKIPVTAKVFARKNFCCDYQMKKTKFLQKCYKSLVLIGVY